MTLTASSMLPLGSIAPDFNLLDTITDESKTLSELKSDKATVIMFICNHCPYVKHIQQQLVALVQEYQAKDIAFIAISSNDVENYPADAPDKMKQVAEQFNYSFPYLYDETQQVAKAYHAECTPDFFIFDHDLKCVYRGQLDDSRPRQDEAVTGQDIRNALDNILDGKPVSENQKPSMGCNIKWKG